MPLKASDIARITGGSLLGNADARVLRGRADSRLCRPGDLYVALVGERADGHQFVAEAWGSGASVALVQSSRRELSPPSGKALVAVDDPLAALQALAGEVRDSSSHLTLVGVTGSNGKTTTKEILAAILRSWAGSDVLVSEGNYNSDIGLPLTLLGLRAHHRFALLEMGMNKRGEIAQLASIARPDIAVITNIGSAHVGMLGSRRAVAEEKREILSHSRSDAVLILPAGGEWNDFLLEGYSGAVLKFSDLKRDSDADVYFDSWRDEGLSGQILVLGGREIRFALPGRHNRLNAAAALAAARALGVDTAAMVEGLESVEPSFGRSEIIKGAVTVIRDCYNANPESLEMALELFKGIAEKGPSEARKVIVLGEMLELGDETDSAVRKAGGAAAALNPDALFLFGGTLEPALEAARAAGYSGTLQWYSDFPELESALSSYLRCGDFVLLKGSRGSALERLDQTIRSVGAA